MEDRVATPAGAADASVSLPLPSPEIAAHILRKVPWDDRIEVSVYQSGPGLMRHSIYDIRHLHGMMKGLPDLTVSIEHLQAWINDVVGDPELGLAIEKAVEREDDSRAEIVRLLESRICQCLQVLGLPDPSTSSVDARVIDDSVDER